MKLNLWLAGLLLVVIGVLLWGRAAIEICWDGIDVNEPLLKELCGISREEYFSPEFEPSTCPEAEQALRVVGGCDTDWASVVMYTAWAGGGYLLVSLVAFVGWRLITTAKKRNSNN
jgi:hypothetical protein